VRALPSPKLQFGTFSPGGTLFVAVRGEGPSQGAKDLELFDGTTGVSRQIIPMLGLRATQPDWSPDGNRIAFTAVDLNAPYLDQRPGIGAIAYVERDSGRWSSPRTAVGSDPGSNYYLPSFAPDSELIAYVDSSCPPGGGNYHSLCDGEADPSARLWLAAVPQSPARRPHLLDSVNRPSAADEGNDDLWTSYPRWHPTSFRGPGGKKMYWLTFSSARRPGLRVPPASTRMGLPSGSLLWAAAVDPEAFATGKDPSYAPFLLPYQDPGTSNHAGQWAAQGP
jgi:hypothetical protein